MLLSIMIMANWYVCELAYSDFYSSITYGKSGLGYFTFFFTYCVEAVFVVDIFISIKKSDYVHMHCGELLEHGNNSR